MLPRHVEWKKWSTLDRVTYLAQLAAVATLFATSYLSYAAWREAREARRIQQAMFSAQNAPLIQIERASVEESFEGHRTLMITFFNSGGSVSLRTCATITVSEGVTIRDYCTQPNSQVKSLRPSQSFFYSLPLDENATKILGFVPMAAATRKLGEEVVNCRVKGDAGRLKMLNVVMKFEDVLGQEMVENAEVAVCNGTFMNREPSIVNSPS